MSDVLGLRLSFASGGEGCTTRLAYLSNSLWLAIQSAWGSQDPLDHANAFIIVRGHCVPDRVLKASGIQIWAVLYLTAKSAFSHDHLTSQRRNKVSMHERAHLGGQVIMRSP